VTSDDSCSAGRGQDRLTRARPAPATTERTRRLERLDKVGPDRIGEVALELSPEELARWLADPNAR
jgi:hypothetical protein